MLLKDLVSDSPKILLWGRPGTGKTVFATSYGAGMQIIDCNQGLLSAVKFQDKFTIERQKIDVIQIHEKIPDKAIAYAQVKETIMSIYNQLVKKTYPFKILCIDSFTDIADFALRYIQGNSSSFGKAISMQQWGLAINELDSLFMWVKAMPIPVVVLFHSKEGTDTTDHATEEIAIYGKNLPSKITSYFDEVLRVKLGPPVQGKCIPIIQTDPEAYMTVRTRGQVKSGQSTNIGLRELLSQLGWTEAKEVPAQTPVNPVK